MPPQMKLQAIKAADLVAQIAIGHIESPNIRAGQVCRCTVTGRVLRVFAGTCDVGTRISFEMAVYSLRPPPGDCYQDIEAVRSSRLIEAYLTKATDEIGTWRAIETVLIPEIGDKPTLLSTLQESLPPPSTDENDEPATLRERLRRLLKI